MSETLNIDQGNFEHSKLVQPHTFIYTCFVDSVIIEVSVDFDGVSLGIKVVTSSACCRNFMTSRRKGAWWPGQRTNIYISKNITSREGEDSSNDSINLQSYQERRKCLAGTSRRWGMQG